MEHRSDAAIINPENTNRSKLYVATNLAPSNMNKKELRRRRTQTTNAFSIFLCQCRCYRDS